MNAVSHPRIVPGKVEERKYQTAMVNGCIGCNTLVILPTGLGKTVVALPIEATSQGNLKLQLNRKEA